jgi:GWxTD domain-containing protein
VLILTFLAAVPRALCQEQSLGQNILDADESNLLRWLPESYRDWLIRDVGYIVTKQERHGFLQLTTDNDREDFIKKFWQRRNPDPDSPENEYKTEVYRRIAYSNDHFSVGNVAGWITDRGRIYITFGPPDQIWLDRAPSVGSEEKWQYRYLEGIGG